MVEPFCFLSRGLVPFYLQAHISFCTTNFTMYFLKLSAPSSLSFSGSALCLHEMRQESRRCGGIVSPKLEEVLGISHWQNLLFWENGLKI